MRIFMRPHQFLYLYLAIVTCVTVLLALNYAAWCKDEESEAQQDLIETYRLRLWAAEGAITDLKNKLYSRPENGTLQYPRAAFIPGFPTIYLITPTVSRSEQKADLVRLSHTFLHVPNIHWIVIEDTAVKTRLVTSFLRTCGLNYTHLNVATPPEVKMTATDPRWLKPRGVLQRNAGLEWIRVTAKMRQLEPGVVYFADDDNTYSLQLFEEMRWTRKVSVWPVGLVGALRYESPIVVNGQPDVSVSVLHMACHYSVQVKGWLTFWKPDRPFAMDMAGFAVNLGLILSHPSAQFSIAAQRGYQESSLLNGLMVTPADLEPKAENCTKVLVWHTRTEKTKLKNEEKMKQMLGKGTDPDVEI